MSRHSFPVLFFILRFVIETKSLDILKFRAFMSSALFP